MEGVFIDVVFVISLIRGSERTLSPVPGGLKTRFAAAGLFFDGNSFKILEACCFSVYKLILPTRIELPRFDLSSDINSGATLSRLTGAFNTA